mmetsp:Transcript_28332/g.79647  ORF Transcript_28332/g.79647 Transcript_28332/m.79647 type:complete len:270 (-) Transcript_28332:82-891(-)
MSFQDFGRNNRNSTKQATTTAGLQTTKNQVSSGWSGFSASATSSGNSLAQISESLTQYQRNVGILEKIAQQLLSSSVNRSRASEVEELDQQYKVQLDVLRQLEQRVRDQLQAQRQATGMNEGRKQTLTKLTRDFERVQSSAEACRARVTRQQKQLQQRGAAGGGAAMGSSSESANALQQEQARFEQQMMQDRMQEEIMREREEEIRKINQGMHTVNQIYKDLASIVGSQQEQVDQIETQMDDAKQNATSGLEQVQKANEKYNSSQCVIS